MQIRAAGTPVPRRDVEAATRGSGPVKTYTLSPEELAKYGPVPQPRNSNGVALKRPMLISATKYEKERVDMSKSKYPQITKEFLEKELSAGKTLSQIEREQGMPKASLPWYLKKFGVTKPAVPAGKVKEVTAATPDAELTQEVERLRNELGAAIGERNKLQDEIEQLKQALTLLNETKSQLNELQTIEKAAAEPGLTFNRYQSLASRTANTDWDVISVRLIRNPKLLPLLNFSLGAAGEAGEVADEIKKVVFHGHSLDMDKLSKEIGDVLWYLSQLVNVCDIELETVAEWNIEKLKARYLEGFSEAASRERADVG